MPDRLPAGIRHRFYTANVVVEYTTQAESAADGVDPSLPAGTLQERTITFTDGTVVGILEPNLANLHPDNTEVAPAYVQSVGLYAEYFLTQWLNPPYLVRDPRTPDVDTGLPPNRVEYRILDVGFNGVTRSDWTFIKIKPVLKAWELPDDVPHELVHRIQFLYNPLMKDLLADDAVGIYGVLREGGAVFCTDTINDSLNRYAFQCASRLKNPQNFSLTVYHMTGNYGGCILWKYLGEQHRSMTHPDGPIAAEFEVFRIVLEESATVGAGAPGLGYTIQALRNAMLRMPIAGEWDSFYYLDAARTELDSHETTWGNFLLANYIHGKASTISDARFEYLEDDEQIVWFPAHPPAFNSLAMRADGVDATINDFLIGEADNPFANETVKPWSAWYFRVKPKLFSPPRMVLVDVRTLLPFDQPLVQIIARHFDGTLKDIYRSGSTTFQKSVNMADVGELIVIVAARDVGGYFELEFVEHASATDVMCTRWNTREGTEFEVDPRNGGWTWLSPDVMVGNDVTGNADGRVFADWDNDLRVRLRNKGNTDAGNIAIHLWCRLEPGGPWQLVKDSLGVTQERTNEFLAAGSDAWFDFVWAPNPLAGTRDVWTLKVEVAVPGDGNTDNKMALSRCLAVPFIRLVPSFWEQLFRWFVRVVSFGLVPRLTWPEPLPPGPYPLDIHGERGFGERIRVRAGQRDDATARVVEPLTLPPGLDRHSLVTVRFEGEGGIWSGVTYATLPQGALQTLSREVSGLTSRLARQKNIPGKVVRWMRSQTMKTLTWQMVSVLAILVGGLSVVYVASDDDATRAQLLGFFDNLVPFVMGAVTGSAVAGTTGFLKGRGVL